MYLTVMYRKPSRASLFPNSPFFFFSFPAANFSVRPGAVAPVLISPSDLHPPLSASALSSIAWKRSLRSRLGCLFGTVWLDERTKFSFLPELASETSPK